MSADDDSLNRSANVPFAACAELAAVATVFSVGLYGYTKRQYAQALDGDSTVAPLLPIYLPMMRALPPICFAAFLAFGAELVICKPLADADDIATCDKLMYGLWDMLLETVAIAFVLLFTRRAVTPRTVRESLQIGSAWGVFAGGVIVVVQFVGYDVYQVSSLLLHLAGFFINDQCRRLAKERRPAAVPCCVFAMTARAAFVVTHVLYLAGASDAADTMDDLVMGGYAVGMMAFYYLTLRWDSQYWRGVGSRLVARHEKGGGAANVGDSMQPTLQHALDNVTELLLDWAHLRIEPRSLGSGAFAAVFAGRYKGEPVAVKVFQPAVVTDVEVHKFVLETQVGVPLRHPNVVRVLGLVVCPPTICLVVEYADLGDLRTVLDVVDFSLRHRFELARQAVAGVLYLHTRDPPLLHRDIKSCNYLCSSGGGEALTVKVSDFGEATTATTAAVSERRLTTRVGTALWMAPEMIRHDTVEYAEGVDVYSLAIVLWEILTGAVPYADQNSYVGVFRHVLEGRRPDIPDYCPQPYAALLRDMWIEDPAARPTTEQVALRLDDFISQYVGQAGQPLELELREMAELAQDCLEAQRTAPENPGVAWGHTLADFDWQSTNDGGSRARTQSAGLASAIAGTGPAGTGSFSLAPGSGRYSGRYPAPGSGRFSGRHPAPGSGRYGPASGRYAALVDSKEFREDLESDEEDLLESNA